ncbi:unnamed protein product [Penicillium nalgiovense]|nr:unnamed protein product [Penicillium nalgiovense]
MLLSRADIYAQLARINVVGTELALYYPRHLEVPIICSAPYKFETKSPEGGGCNLITLGARLISIVITATLAFAKISELFGWYHRTHPVPGKDEARLERRKSTGLESRDNRRNTAREFLADALHLCD